MRSAQQANRGSAGASSVVAALEHQRGAVTAEFVIVLPAVLIVMSLAVGAVMLATHRLTLTSAAAEIARLEARGETASAMSRLEALGDGVHISRSAEGSLSCVTLQSQPLGGALGVVSVASRACAVDVQTQYTQ